MKARIDVIFPTGNHGCLNTNGDEYRVDTDEADPGSFVEAVFETHAAAAAMVADLRMELPDCDFTIYDAE